MSDPATSQIKAEPNLTPILDMVFQLITFFMLLVNFKGLEADASIRLPVIGSARPVPGGGEGLLVLNIRTIDDKLSLRVFGQPVPDEQIEAYIAAEAQASRIAAHLGPGDPATGRPDLPDLVVVRADENTPCAGVCRVLAACQQQGYRRFAFRAMNEQPRG